MEYAKDSKERIPFEHYLELFQQADPEEMSARCEVPYDKDTQTFTLEFMNSTYYIKHPEYEITHKEDEKKSHPLEEMHAAKVFVARFLAEGCFAPATGKYLAYRDMPWGEVYYKQFQGRCMMRLAFGFGNKIDKFKSVMEQMGAKSIRDTAYELEYTKGFFVQLYLYEGEDDIPPSSQILFSDNFSVCFSAEDRAVVGDIIIGTMKAY